MHDGARKPPLCRCAMVYKYHRCAGVRWCTKTTVVQVRDGEKTIVGRVRDGVQKQPWDRWEMV